MMLSLVLSGAALVVSFLVDAMGRLMKDSGASAVAQAEADRKHG
jgi:hypothetical protein